MTKLETVPTLRKYNDVLFVSDFLTHFQQSYSQRLVLVPLISRSELSKRTASNGNWPPNNSLHLPPFQLNAILRAHNMCFAKNAHKIVAAAAAVVVIVICGTTEINTQIQIRILRSAVRKHCENWWWSMVDLETNYTQSHTHNACDVHNTKYSRFGRRCNKMERREFVTLYIERQTDRPAVSSEETPPNGRTELILNIHARPARSGWACPPITNHRAYTAAVLKPAQARCRQRLLLLTIRSI